MSEYAFCQVHIVTLIVYSLEERHSLSASFTQDSHVFQLKLFLLHFSLVYDGPFSVKSVSELILHLTYNLIIQVNFLFDLLSVNWLQEITSFTVLILSGNAVNWLKLCENAFLVHVQLFVAFSILGILDLIFKEEVVFFFSLSILQFLQVLKPIV